MKLYELVDSLIRFANNNHSKDFNIWDTEVYINFGNSKSPIKEIDYDVDDSGEEITRKLVISANDISYRNEVTTILEDTEFRRGEVLPKSSCDETAHYRCY